MDVSSLLLPFQPLLSILTYNSPLSPFHSFPIHKFIIFFFFFFRKTKKSKTKQSNNAKNKSHHNLFASFRFFPNFFHIDAILCKERLTGCELTQLCKTQYMLHDHVELPLGLYQIILINVITQDHEILRWHLDILPITWRERLLDLHIKIPRRLSLTRPSIYLNSSYLLKMTQV